jgi:hypothetical protein
LSDTFDLLLHRAARAMDFINMIENFCLSEAHHADKNIGYLPAKDFLVIAANQTVAALDVMCHSTYADRQVMEPDFLTCAARIGTPNLVHYGDLLSGRHETQYWPRADRPATRPDLLHFYLLVKLKYLTLKAEMQNRAPTPEELADLAEIAEIHIHLHPSTPTTPESFRNDVLQSWRKT